MQTPSSLPRRALRSWSSVLPDTRFLSADGAHPALATAAEVLFPTSWGCLLATNCDPAALLRDFVWKVLLFLTWSRLPAPHFTTQHTAGRLGRMQYFETSPRPTNWIGIGWWTEKLLGTDTPRQCDCTSFISLEKQANSAGVCQ